MKTLIFILLCLTNSCSSTNNPPERPESAYISSEMKFENNAGIYYASRISSPWVTRWIVTGNHKKDSVTVAEGKYSLCLQWDCDAYYYTEASRIEGDSLIFSGKYKYSNAKNGTFYFYILQKDRYESIERPPIPDTLVMKNVNGNGDQWYSFTIRAKLKEDIHEIRFGVKTKGIEKTWIDDWDILVDKYPVYRFIKTHYPAEDDKEFDNGSNIKLPELTPQLRENLNILGRVWGFMKYYHPKIAEGDVNWDYELFRILPDVAKAKNLKDMNRTILKWIEKFGDFPVTTHTVIDSFYYPCLIDNSWINNKKIFTPEVTKALNKVENAVRSNKVNYYLIPFRGGPRDRNFRAEKPYEKISWEDQGFRLLTLFRFWNVMQYNFPYKDLTDKPWDSVLYEFIPEFFLPENKPQYLTSLMKLMTNINDTHGRIMITEPVYGTPAERFSFRRKYPVNLTETAKGEFCVMQSRTAELLPGDIILNVDGKPVRDIFNELSPYVTASNYAALSRNIRPNLLSTNNNDIDVEINRNGNIIPLKLTSFNSGKVTGIKEMSEYENENKDIIFLNVGRLPANIMVETIKKNMSAKGIVFDLREYPREFTSFFKLSDVLLPHTAINLWFSSQVITYPGHYRKYNECPIGFENPDYFKGKVAILVNENTQSLGEMTAIALSNAPQAAVIGTTTAGADGNITSFVLPGGINVLYTVFGAYYPNWGQCQRTGVIIDIEVQPTVEDIKAKKDALIEKAIEYIRN